MVHCLVTGGAGFIGSNLVDALLAEGHTVRVLDNLSTGKRKNLLGVLGEIQLIEGDIRSESVVADAVQDIEVVFHQAALASVPRSMKNPLATHDHCVSGTVNVLHQAVQAGVRRVVYAASSSAYGNGVFSSKRECDNPAPLSPYAAAKLAGEYYCQAFASAFPIETVCLRYFNVFGPRQDPQSEYAAVIPKFVTAVLSAKRPVIYGDGEQSRDFTYIENVIQANLRAATVEGVSGKVFNAANGKTTSLLQLLTMISELCGAEVNPEFAPVRRGDVRNSLADIAQSRLLLGYEPAVDVAEGLERTVEYYRNQMSADM